jgi:polysaccharide biosynthesis transport protein
MAAIPEKPTSSQFHCFIHGSVRNRWAGLIAASTILLIDYFDDTLKSSQKIREVLGVPVVGEIVEADQIKKVGNFYSDDRTSSMLLNAFGLLRINVSRLIAQKSLKTILVTSPALGEGKTTIALNLAETFVHSGRKVVLLDADLYHSSLHSRLGLDNQSGLTDILADDLDWQAAARQSNGLTVITSGTHSPSSSNFLLESEGMTQLLEKIQKKADVVILDGPPLFVMDAQILASKVGGILLVIRQGNTLTSVARDMINQLDLMDANLLGVVLNRVKRRDSYYSDIHYYDVRENKAEEKEKVLEIN